MHNNHPIKCNQQQNPKYSHKNLLDIYIPAIDILPNYINIDSQSIALMGEDETIKNCQKLMIKDMAKEESISVSETQFYYGGTRPRFNN